MIIKGNSVGCPLPDPRKYMIVVSDTPPVTGPTLWFNTAPGGAVNQPAVLMLDDDETGYDMQAVVGDETYGMKNATVNQGASAGNYDFTVL